MKKGFTLIELMVVIGVIVILTVGSITGLVYSSKEKNVRGTADKLRSVISAAVSLAQAPNEGDFGTYKIQVRVYTSDSSLVNDQNKVKVFKCTTNLPDSCVSEITGLSFEAPDGVFIDAGRPPEQGGLDAVPNSGTPKQFYYFSILATSVNGKYIGQIVDTTGTTDRVFLIVSNTSNPPDEAMVYKIITIVDSGLVTEEYGVFIP